MLVAVFHTDKTVSEHVKRYQLSWNNTITGTGSYKSGRQMNNLNTNNTTGIMVYINSAFSFQHGGALVASGYSASDGRLTLSIIRV
jgi:hypothetical protein